VARGDVEWEACNLLDRGCEFGGSPSYGDEPLGTTLLPSYLRIDLGIRKHWHFRAGPREGTVALFGTLTNILNGGNVLTYTRDAAGGALRPIEMIPISPLVVGIDWRF
jgi:hypothetical protein